MPKVSVLAGIKKIKRLIFRTGEAAACSGGSLSNTVQALNHLEKEGVVIKIARGLWSIDLGAQKVSQYSVIPFLLPRGRVYVSFLSALHLYGIIEQIPQSVTLASTAHTRVIRTKLGAFYVHRIAPAFFKGFDWYKGDGDFLIAEPEKALVDCLYLSAKKGKQFSYFPELRFPKSFSFRKVENWIRQIPDPKARLYINKRLERLKAEK